MDWTYLGLVPTDIWYVLLMGEHPMYLPALTRKCKELKIASLRPIFQRDYREKWCYYPRLDLEELMSQRLAWLSLGFELMRHEVISIPELIQMLTQLEVAENIETLNRLFQWSQVKIMSIIPLIEHPALQGRLIPFVIEAHDGSPGKAATTLAKTQPQLAARIMLMYPNLKYTGAMADLLCYRGMAPFNRLRNQGIKYRKRGLLLATIKYIQVQTDNFERHLKVLDHVLSLHDYSPEFLTECIRLTDSLEVMSRLEKAGGTVESTTRFLSRLCIRQSVELWDEYLEKYSNRSSGPSPPVFQFALIDLIRANQPDGLNFLLEQTSAHGLSVNLNAALLMTLNQARLPIIRILVEAGANNISEVQTQFTEYCCYEIVEYLASLSPPPKEPKKTGYHGSGCGYAKKYKK